MFTNRWFQGLWTQRNPFRDAGSTRIEEVFYGSRGDGLIDGLNVEISNRLTLVRRPGTSVYNSQTFPAIIAFYEFRLFSGSTESIKVMADTASVLYDATGPSTKTTIWNKSAGAGQTYMQSVGDILYFGNGVDQKKWIQSTIAWAPATTFTQGQFIVDPSNNLQLAVGSQTAQIAGIAISSNVLTVFFSPTTPFVVLPVGAKITFSGLTTATYLNNQTLAITSVQNSIQLQFSYTHGDEAYAVDTGSATTGTSISGGVQPTWSETLGGITADGTVQWVCRGSSVQNWGIVSPTNAPTVTQAPAPSQYPNWAANTWYGPAISIVDTNDNVQLLTTGGITGASQPVWNLLIGGTTTDGTAVWTNKGQAAWAPNKAYILGALVQTTFTYYTTTYVYLSHPPYQQVEQVEIQVTCFFRVTTAGTSGASTPGWVNGINTTVNDGTVVWTNVGTAATWATIGATQNVSVATQVLDSHGNVQTAQVLGESGSAAPTWATAQGSSTTDNEQTWLNAGPYDAGGTGAWLYAYSYENSLTGHISTAGPESQPVTLAQGNQIILQGAGSPDVQVDTIHLWRTTQGGSILLDLDTIPNPGSGQTWVYTDTTADTGLDDEIEAPINGVNNPPPAGLIALSYHLGCIWGVVGNTVYRSGGPDTTAGSGNESFSVSDSFVYPDSTYRLFPCTLGLVVFTASQPYIISGTNTSNFPLISIPYLNNPGLLSYNAFDVNGSLPNFLTSDLQMVTFDPSSGVNEVGFPIQDQFVKVTTGGIDASLYSATRSYVAWHVYGEDKGLFVSDGATGWFRLSPTPAPETGLTWSPFAALAAGCSAVQSIEVIPGIHNLLIGPKTSGPILKRDTSVWSDNGMAYNAYATLGSVVPAQPGQYASLEFMTADSIKIGTPLTLAAQLDEIGYPSQGLFESLTEYVHDPTELPNNTTLNQQRFYLSQTQKPAICRSFQVQINFGSDTVQNELLNFSVFGGFAQEK